MGRNRRKEVGGGRETSYLRAGPKGQHAENRMDQRISKVGILMMIRIKPETIYALRNSTGRPFTDVMDRLIRHSASVASVSQDAVATNARTNYPDGGVDTQVSSPLTSDKRGYFQEKSVWQFKAHEEKALTKKKLADEITDKSKTYLRELLQTGYAYRICIADNAPAKRKTQLETWANEAIQTIATGAPPCKVLFADDVVAWVNSFPGIAAELSGADLGDFFHFETWTRQARGMTRTFVPTPESEIIWKTVQNHIQWANKPATARLTVSGDAGVGKTRTVFEAIAAMPEIAPLVIYTDDELKALEQARSAANDGEQYVIIVADECLDGTASQMESMLQGVEGRVRIITIDNALERMDQTDLRLQKVNVSTLEKIIEENFSNIDPGRRLRYCHLADGSLRFAITLCLNDGLMQQEGNLGEALRDATHYLNRYFGTKGPFDEADRTALEVISLVERCGVFGGVASELESLCTLASANAGDIRDRLVRMQKSNGLAGRAGRYYYVTPQPVAMACFHRAWKRWIEPDPRSFLEKFPRELVPSLLARLQRAPEGVGKVVNDYFRKWILSRGSDIFRSDVDTEQLLLLVRSNPDQMIPRLEQLVMAATAEQIAPGFRTGRRRLVVELVQIASFPQWFEQAEAMLFSLSVDDPEPQLGNNATKLWSQLFPVISSVGTPFDKRFAILEWKTRSGKPEQRLLCVSAFSEMLHDSSIRLTSPGTYGNRIAPQAWRPQTWEEYFGYVTEAIQTLSRLCSDEDATVRDQAVKVLVSSVRSLIFRGILGPAKEGARNMPDEVRPILRAELREFLLLNNSEHSPHSEQEKEQRARFVAEWIAELAPQSLHDQLVEEIGPECWDHHLEQSAWDARIRELALRLVNNGAEFRAELPWLNGPNAKSVVEFSGQIGRLDDTLSYLQLIAATCVESRNPHLARGYFAGLADKTRPLLPSQVAKATQRRLNDALDGIWRQDPVLAYQVMTPSGEFLRSFERTIVAVQDHQLPAGALQAFQAWNGPVHTSPREARIAAETLLHASIGGDKHAASLGIDFVVYLLQREQPDDKTAFLQAVFEDSHLNTIFTLFEEVVRGSEKISPYFVQIFARALPADPKRGIKIVVKMMQSESYEVGEAAAGLIQTVAAVDPQYLMEKLGIVLLAEDTNVRFFLRRFPLIILPEEVLKRWIDTHGLTGARLFARYMPRPFIGGNGPDLHPVTKFVLERFGNDDQVFSSWVAGMTNGQAFAGSIADWVERRAEFAERFLTYPLEAVRRWARSEISFASDNAEDFRQTEEERF
jgi:hypothetical protein